MICRWSDLFCIFDLHLPTVNHIFASVFSDVFAIMCRRPRCLEVRLAIQKLTRVIEFFQSNELFRTQKRPDSNVRDQVQVILDAKSDAKLLEQIPLAQRDKNGIIKLADCTSIAKSMHRSSPTI